MTRQNRYKEFERLMTLALLANVVFMVIYLVAAICGVLWLKILFAALTLILPVLGLLLLYLNQELLHQRSLWMSCGFFAIFVCTLVSIILAYP